ncbi:hypothetical protein D3C75_1080860 [compost metagenome]
MAGQQDNGNEAQRRWGLAAQPAGEGVAVHRRVGAVDDDQVDRAVLDDAHPLGGRGALDLLFDAEALENRAEHVQRLGIVVDQQDRRLLQIDAVGRAHQSNSSRSPDTAAGAAGDDGFTR